MFHMWKSSRSFVRGLQEKSKGWGKWGENFERSWIEEILLQAIIFGACGFVEGCFSV